MKPLSLVDNSAAMSMTRHVSRSKMLQLAKPAGLVIEACGRSLQLPDQIRSVEEIQGWLQSEVGMRDHTFELHSQDGEKLLRDEDILNLISAGLTTITATLSDTSIHLIEHRRDELAQTQWKTVWDHQHHSSMKIHQFSVALAALEQALQVETTDRCAMGEQIMGDLAAALEQGMKDVSVGVRHVEEKCAGFPNMITTERNLREAALQRQGSDMQAIRDLISVNRDSINQSFLHVQAQIDGYKKLVDNERSSRAALEAKIRLDIENMNARMDETANGLQNRMLEYQRSFELTTQEMTASFDAHYRNFMKLTTDLEHSHTDGAAKIQIVDHQIKSLDSRLADVIERHSETIDRFGQRNEKIALGLEAVKADAMGDRHNIATMYTSVADMENMMREIRKDVTDKSISERRRREEELNNFKEFISTEYGTRLTQLENRINARLERESAARAGIANEIYEGLKKDAEESSTKSGSIGGANRSTRSGFSPGRHTISNLTSRSVSQQLLNTQNSGSMSIPITRNAGSMSVPPNRNGESMSIPLNSLSMANISLGGPATASGTASSGGGSMSQSNSARTLDTNFPSTNCGSVSIPAGHTVYEPAGHTVYEPSATASKGAISTPVQPVRSVASMMTLALPPATPLVM